jgi:hypothetical protein
LGDLKISEARGKYLFWNILLFNYEFLINKLSVFRIFGTDKSLDFRGNHKDKN